ncbi:MAG: bifunctional UDP-sugar hydrolase/5'-nucleotidase [Candidatus Latescibacterota bacterium]
MLPFLALAALLPPGDTEAANPGSVREVRILFTNNSNGKLEDCNCRNDPFGGLAERVSLVREYRERHPEVLLLDSGGYLGLNDVDRKGPATMRLMEMMNYRAWGVGDQELYRGLKRFLTLSGEHRERMVSATIADREGKRPFAEYRVFPVNSVRIAVLGLTAPETFSFFPKENMDFTHESPESALARLLPALRKEADYIIALSQMGRKTDEAIAAKAPGIDLIIGGHSQTLLEKEIPVGKCRIVQAGKGGGRVGEVTLEFDGSNRLKQFSYKLLEVNEKYSVPQDVRVILDKTGQ